MNDLARTIRVVTLYPDVMSIYADRGNLIALRARCRQYGIGCEVTAVGIGDGLPADADLVLIGGGQDQEQRRIAADLAARGVRLRDWAEDDVAMLTICGGFQLFGHFYRTAEGEELPGVGIFDVTTVAPAPGAPRCIGDVLADAGDFGEVVGFENHGGRTYLGPHARPFARMRHGFGNNGDDGTEGAVYREAIGTYLHGSLLPKNPAVTDRLILAALRHRYGPGVMLETLPPDPYAERAHRAAAAVARRRGRPNP
ncbi:MAG TPA: glutamine amidotransferase [Dehalococcoidia bacterium]|nr:glutamine amidotransferase [Dehalococcoidia bacterium]